jgi:hypothetical protein
LSDLIFALLISTLEIQLQYTEPWETLNPCANHGDGGYLGLPTGDVRIILEFSRVIL